MVGILVRDMLADSTSMGSPGLDNICWLLPVRVGDSVRLTVRVLDKRVSKSKPDRGIVKTRWEAHNQNGELVLTVDSNALCSVCAIRPRPHEQRASRGGVFAPFEFGDGIAMYFVRTVREPQRARRCIRVRERKVIADAAAVRLDRPVDHLTRDV
ncbi:MaoC-like dehydratase [Candidatus Burkholderia brachyanthoides]|nr:MaoC-like dehydratase [Candidatus Burkholderia brachyanthoides]